MRGWFLAVLCAGCVANNIVMPNAPAIVALEEALAPPPDCKLSGTGEARGAPPFAVYESIDAQAPLLIVSDPERVNIAWSHFPKVGTHVRARSDLAGQGVRLEGWTSLEGHRFQMPARAFVIGSAEGGVWIRGGSPVAIQGMAKNGVRVKSDDSRQIDDDLHATTSCTNLVYTSEYLNTDAPIDHDEKAPMALAARDVLTFRARPDASEPVVRMEADSELVLHIKDERDNFLRVTGVSEYVAFDAWVPTSEINRQPMGFSGSSHCGGVFGGFGRRARRRAEVLADTPLLVGALGHVRPTSAVLEKGTMVELTGETDGDNLGFDFESTFEAPDHEHFFANKDRLR
jgi:hypothetical protein